MKELKSELPWFLSHKVLTSAILILLLVVINGVYDYWRLSKSIEQNLEQPSAPVHESEMSDWKTYRNEDIGYEFKYPTNLYTKSDVYSFHMDSSPLKMFFGAIYPDEGVEGKDFVLSGYSFYILTKEMSDISLVSRDEYKVTKLDYPQIQAYDIVGDGPAAGSTVYIKDPKLPNTFVLMGFNANCPNIQTCKYEDVNKIFNQILSTFKFIE